MARQGENWAYISVRFLDDPKMVRAGRDGRDLQLAAVLYAVDHETDGFVPTEYVSVLAMKAGIDDCDATVQRLVEVDAWHPVDGGYAIHGFLGWQTPAAERRAAREASAQRQRDYRDRKRAEDTVTANEQAPSRATSRVTRDKRASNVRDLEKRRARSSSSSSSGPSHQEPGPVDEDDDDQQKHDDPSPPDPVACHERVARAVNAERGRRASLRTTSARFNPDGHAKVCAENSWATNQWFLTALVEENPTLTVLELADLADTRELAMAGPAPPGGAPGGAGPRRQPCGGCSSLSHTTDACPAPIDPAELAEIRRQLGESP